MNEVYVVFGRTESYSVGYFSNANDIETMDVYGVFTSFDSALAEFKNLVGKAHKEFCEIVPLNIEEDMLEEIKEAELFEDTEYEDCVRWSCDIDESWSAYWEMYSLSSDPTETPLLPKLYIVKQTLES